MIDSIILTVEKRLASMTKLELDRLATNVQVEAEAEADQNLERVDAIESVLRRPSSIDPHFSGVHTATAERRMRERLEKEGFEMPEDEQSAEQLSPAEKRALDAEKRAAWRKARLKSLENVTFLTILRIKTIQAPFNIAEFTRTIV